MTGVALLVITDGRDAYLDQAIRSTSRLVGEVEELWMYDDTGDDEYRAVLADRYPDWTVLGEPGRRLGASGAVRAAWRALRDSTKASFVFHLEQDFTIDLPVNLGDMTELLDRHPHIAQVVLRRQAWNPNEKAAGGVVEQHPDWYSERCDGGIEWLEHRAYWSNNPCLYRSSLLMHLDWPEHVSGCWGEDTFHQRLLRTGTPEVPGPQVRYAYWGLRDTALQVTHIGHRRSLGGKDY